MSEKQELALVPATFDQALRMAEQLAPSTLLPEALRKRPADVLLTIMAGQELGLSPIASIRGIHIIEGRPAVSADLMVALVKRSPLCVYFREVSSDDTMAIYETQRKGDPPQRASFTIEQARRAKLLDRGRDPSMNNWNRFPAAMLRARAKSALARSVYEDLLFGCYTPDELGLGDGAIDLVEIAPGAYQPPPPPATTVITTPADPTTPAPPVETSRSATEPASEDAAARMGATESVIGSEVQQIADAMTTAAAEGHADELKALAKRAALMPKGPDRDWLEGVYRASRKQIASRQEQAGG